MLLLYRPYYYLKQQRPERKTGEEREKFSKRLLDWTTKTEACRHTADVISAKLRDGETSTVQLYWDEERTMFGDLDRHHGAEEAQFL